MAEDEAETASGRNPPILAVRAFFQVRDIRYRRCNIHMPRKSHDRRWQGVKTPICLTEGLNLLTSQEQAEFIDSLRNDEALADPADGNDSYLEYTD